MRELLSGSGRGAQRIFICRVKTSPAIATVAFLAICLATLVRSSHPMNLFALSALSLERGCNLSQPVGFSRQRVSADRAYRKSSMGEGQ